MVKFKVPKEIKLGGVTLPIKTCDNVSEEYTILYNEGKSEDEPLMVNNGAVDGFFNPDIKGFGIYVDKRMSGDRLENTFLHEVIHAILSHMQEHDLNDNEHLVQNLADKFQQVIHQCYK